MSVVCCQAEVSARGWSFVQRSLTECLHECDCEASKMRRPRPPRGCCANETRKKKALFSNPVPETPVLVTFAIFLRFSIHSGTVHGRFLLYPRQFTNHYTKTVQYLQLHSVVTQTTAGTYTRDAVTDAICEIRANSDIYTMISET